MVIKRLEIKIKKKAKHMIWLYGSLSKECFEILGNALQMHGTSDSKKWCFSKEIQMGLKYPIYEKIL